MTQHHRPSSISYVQFGALTAQEWESFSIEIKKPHTRGSQDMYETPYDPRLGALDNNVVCETCGQTNKNCPGHWGHIKLEEPCYNPEYIDIVLGILKCICISCVSPLIPENVMGRISGLKRSVRFKAYKKKAETLKQCPVCQELIASFFIDKHIIKMFYEEKKNAVPITAREACAILMRISSETMGLIGFNDGLSDNPKFMAEDIILPEDKIHVHEVRPEAFVFMVFPVMPTCARPWVIKGSERKDDDITDKYNTILKNNERLRADREAPAGAQPVRGRKKNGKLTEADRFKTIDDLHANIWSVIDNSKEKSKNSSRKHKGLRERLCGKDGHLQSNVAGKRSDYTARTVIVGGGSLLKMGWIGVPYRIAKTLTNPELVLDYNIEECERLLRSGKINTVCRGGFTIDIKEVTGNGTKPFIWKGRSGLLLYDIVHRQLRDGDWGIFNRQPTLRIESMQGVQLKILPGGEDMNIFDQEYAWRLSLATTRAYNADFDGDEMNLHIPQSQGARVECSTISKTAYHIVSAQNNAPCMGAVQNTLVLMYLITETFLTPETTAEGEDMEPNYTFPDGTPGYQTMIDLSDFMDAISAADISVNRFQDLIKRSVKYYPDYVVEDDDGNLRFTDRVPGKIVASIVFPPTFTWSRETGINEKLPTVIIKDGVIQPNSGPLEKKSIGGISNSSIHPLWKRGPEVAEEVISELQFMTTVLITRIGFSIGPSDCFPTGEIDVHKVITEALIKCEMILASDKDPQDKEREINGALNSAMSVAPILAKSGMNKKDRNALVIMKKSGAKGSDTNNGQIAGLVGQQNIDGKRVPCMLSDGTRTLPHFFSGDRSPAALGFVQHSYLEGLNFFEVWFHAMGGRRGVVDTALKTADWHASGSGPDV
jgi:DNA-directed RNA polymerase II subunit RPB1